MLFHELQNAGLSDNEAKVYLAALELGETTVERLSQKSGVKRTTVYLAVESLNKKGLVSHYKKKRKSFYFAENPQKIKNLLEEKMTAMTRIMPQLLSITNLIDKKPIVRFYQGDEGIKEVFRDILENSTEKFYAWYSEVWQNEFDEKWMREVFTATRVKKKIWVDCIQPNNEHFRELTKTNSARLHRSKLVDPNLFKLSITLNLYGKNKIVAVSSKEKFGLIIESQEIYESLLSLHKTMWNLIPGEII